MLLHQLYLIYVQNQIIDDETRELNTIASEQVNKVSDNKLAIQIDAAYTHLEEKIEEEAFKAGFNMAKELLR